MRISEIGFDGLCVLCRSQLDLSGTKQGGAMLTKGGAQLVTLCSNCASDGSALQLVADAISDCALDGAGIAAEFAEMLGLPE